MKKQKVKQYDDSLAMAAQRSVRTLFGVIEILLAFRLIFKGLGANTGSSFVKSIYSVTNYIVIIFEGIFALLKSKLQKRLGLLSHRPLLRWG